MTSQRTDGHRRIGRAFRQRHGDRAGCDRPHRVDIQQQRPGTAFIGSLGVENVGIPERQLERLHFLRVLVEQEANSVAGAVVLAIVRSIAGSL